MLDNILCYACGDYVRIEVGRPAASSFEANKKAREENKCPKCGVALELEANLEAGKERMKSSEAQYRKMQADRMGFA